VNQRDGAKRANGAERAKRTRGAKRGTPPRRTPRRPGRRGAYHAWRRMRRRARLRRAVRKRSSARPNTFRIHLGTARDSPLLRRGVLAAVLLAVVFAPSPVPGAPAAGAVAACPKGCHAGPLVRWTAALDGQWDVQPGVAGTVPVEGVAYAAAGNGLAVVAEGLTIDAYNEYSGRKLWTSTLTGFPVGAAISSVRAWPGEITAGVTYQTAPGMPQREEVSLESADGIQTGPPHQAALFGGAVAGTAAFTTIIGPTAVVSYPNGTGRTRPRWSRQISPDEAWQSDGRYLYLAESRGGYLTADPVKELQRIDLVTGAEQNFPPATSFDGSLAAVADGVVLFSAADGVNAYDPVTGVLLWSLAGAVPEGADPDQGADPGQGRIYLTRGASLLSVDPQTGKVLAQAQDQGAQSGMYVVRHGVALGLDQGSDGAAWGFDLASQRVVKQTASRLGWPHYFTDLDPAGGSADPVGDLVIIAACNQLAPQVQPSPTPDASAALSGSPDPTVTTSPGPAAQGCQSPELVALSL
jgi:outer membrane protein assembly factor BamB